MTKEAEYDVFISYSRSDYVYDRDTNNVPNPDSPISKLMEFLDKNGIKCWIDTKGIYLGDSFPKELKDAINDSKMLVFASSKSSNASKWTPREIGYADKRDKKILPFRIDDTPYGEDIEIFFPITQHCNYYSDPERAFDSLLEGVKKAKEEYRRKREAEEKAERVLTARKELDKQEKEYDGLISRIKPVADRIADLEITIGNTARTCPVCGSSVPMKDYFCDACGWAFVPPFRLDTEIDESHLNKVKDIWNASRDGVAKIRELEDRMSAARRALSENAGKLITAEKNVSDLHAQISQKDEALACVNKELSSVKQQYEEEKTGRKEAEEKFQRLTSELERKAREEEGKKFTGHEYVDLGLPSGLLWATCNVGADSPERSGDYFAWGETAPKESYTWETLNYCNDKTGDSFSKYNIDQKGTKDIKMQLELSDDVARANWGGSWRMPAHKDWVELYDNCSIGKYTLNGVKGRLFTSKLNGNSIFLSAAGWRNDEELTGAGSAGFYWSSSLCPDRSYYAFGCLFNSYDVLPSGRYYRYLGSSVRPVASPSPSQK